MAIEFGDGKEPWSVARGGVKRWLHCRVDVEALPEEQRAEIAEWLESRGIPAGSRLLVTRGQAGNHMLHVGAAVVEVGLADLPMWLQRPEPSPEPQKPVAAPRVSRSKAAA